MHSRTATQHGKRGPSRGEQQKDHDGERHRGKLIGQRSSIVDVPKGGSHILQEKLLDR